MLTCTAVLWQPGVISHFAPSFLTVLDIQANIYILKFNTFNNDFLFHELNTEVRPGERGDHQKSPPHFTLQCFKTVFFCGRRFSVISLCPSAPSSLVPNRRVFIPLENFSFNLSFLYSSAGAKSYPLRESKWRAHAWLYGEWFTDVYREWIDQRQSHDRRSIKHQIKDGNPRAERKLKMRHSSVSLLLGPAAHQTL